MKSQSIHKAGNLSFICSAVSEVPVDELISLYKSAGWWNDLPFEKETLPLLVKNSFCFVSVRTEEGRLIGMGRAISDGVSDAYLQDIFIEKNYRKMGIGSRIVKMLTAQCRKRGISWIALIANPGTDDFYRELGFEVMPEYVPMILSVKPGNGTVRK